MDLATWAWVSIAVNCAAACLCGFRLFRLRRTLIETEAMQSEIEAMQSWYASEAERIFVLDTLLMRFCLEAAGRDCWIVWQAWAQTMGEIRVQLGGQFRGRMWSTEGLLFAETDHETSSE